MRILIIFLGSGLLVYWTARVFLLMHGTQDEIDETLACDLWWGRRLLLSVQSCIEPPHQLVG